ncbi:MAG: hypothetical protein D6687_04865 [Acidobacteria bacterium]|jgi:uncharacterized membrane protein|nr:MAG: hypothetical protein D6687_04865 [Acidobacteriota bacterium]GIU82875.1 MAG: hypothetical protein KatS3mg006_1939 [Pyrinomonadaceae bacterium]
MPSVAIVCGILLILLGVIGYSYGLMTQNASPTALIPAAFGIVLLLLGFVSEKKENLRKHLMHLAVVVALIGFIVPASRIISKAGELTLNFATLMLISMALVCLVFVILGVKSFIDARRQRKET